MKQNQNIKKFIIRIINTLFPKINICVSQICLLPSWSQITTQREKYKYQLRTAAEVLLVFTVL